MHGNIFYLDQYIEVMADRVNVNYDTHTDAYDLAEIEETKLSSERSKDWLKLWLLIIGISLAAFFISMLALYQHGVWQWLLSPSLLIGLLINGYLQKAIQNSTRWTLTLETTYGPANVLTSTDGLYLSRVRRAINKAIKARDNTLIPA